ncbi:MAG TPA: hypothetical protein VEQ85_11925 [Lacipirellulaceae bacterium]|nr:hypothetical protein [Lacipirellulaceae bacterium]
MRRSRFSLAAVLAASLLPAGAPRAAAEVEIASASGPTLRGELDARSDESRAWVRQTAGEGAISLATSIKWSDVTRARWEGEALAGEALKVHAREAATPAPRWEEFWNAAPAVAPAPPASPAPGVDSPRRSGANARVRSLTIVDAWIVNLDRDVEPDGLAVAIVAIGEDGRPQVARGNVSVRLWGERRPADRPTVAFGVLDQWTAPVDAGDWIEGVATIELPFRRTAPEWEFDLAPDAVIEVRLGVYGEGNFAASAPVLLRPFNPLRDHRQLHHRTRFMPRELHGREPASRPGGRDGRWLPWTW